MPAAPEPQHHVTTNASITLPAAQPAMNVSVSQNDFESLSSSEEPLPPKAKSAAAISKPIVNNPPPAAKPVAQRDQSPAKVVQQQKPVVETKEVIPPLPSRPEPAGQPAAAAAGGANKLWLDMTITEFKAWCDANGKPTPDFNENKLPPGFEKPPAKPVYKEGSTREEYKAYMVAKYEYETWENKVVLYNIKLKKKIEELDKMK